MSCESEEDVSGIKEISAGVGWMSDKGVRASSVQFVTGADGGFPGEPLTERVLAPCSEESS